MSTETKSKVGYNLNILIAQAGINQKELARRAGISPGILSSIINGRSCNMTLNTVTKLADALEIATPDLLRKLHGDESLVASERKIVSERKKVPMTVPFIQDEAARNAYFRELHGIREVLVRFGYIVNPSDSFESKVDEMGNELLKLREDKARLDWISRSPNEIGDHLEKIGWRASCDAQHDHLSFWLKNIRTFIDTAREGGGVGNEFG